MTHYPTTCIPSDFAYSKHREKSLQETVVSTSKSPWKGVIHTMAWYLLKMFPGHMEGNAFPPIMGLSILSALNDWHMPLVRYAIVFLLTCTADFRPYQMDGPVIPIPCVSFDTWPAYFYLQGIITQNARCFSGLLQVQSRILSLRK